MLPKLTRKEMKLVHCNEELRRYRNEICYTQEYVASQLGITQSTYQRIESGEIKISIERLIIISRLFGKPIEAFLKNDENLITKVQTDEDEQMINIYKREWDLIQKVVAQQEKRIEELEAKMLRKDNKIEELKQILNLSNIHKQKGQDL